MSTVTSSLEKPNPYLAVSTFCLSLGCLLKPDNTYEEPCGKYLALTGTEACFVLGAIVGLIETVFWSAIFLLVKTIHLFIPKSFETPTSICNWFYGRAVVPLFATSFSFLGVVYNFFTTKVELDKSSEPVDSAIKSGLEMCEGYLNYQLFDC